MFTINKKVLVTLTLLASAPFGWATAPLLEKSQALDLSQCSEKLERSSHLSYRCWVPAMGLQETQSIIRAESVERVLYPCAIEVESDNKGFHVVVRRLNHNKFRNFSQGDAAKCLRQVERTAGPDSLQMKFLVGG